VGPEKDGYGPAVIDDRATLVRRRFKQARLDARGRGFWEHWRPKDSAFLVGMFSSVLLLFLEPALWSDIWPAGMIDVRVPDGLAASLLLILPFNGWLVDRFLSNKTPRETTFPRWLLAMRGLFASLPLIGLYVISFWRVALDRKSFLRTTSPVALDLHHGQLLLPAAARSRALYRSGFFFVWMATSLLPLLVWTVWLAQTPALGAHRRAVILGACALLHLLAGASMNLYFRQEIRSASLRGWRRTLFLIVPFLWLLALPGMVLGFAVFLFADPSHTALSWKIHASRTAVGRDPLWKSLELGARRQWQEKPWFAQWQRPSGLLRPEATGSAERQVTSFYRLKTLLLSLDAAALFGVISRMAARWPALTNPLNIAIRGIFWTAGALAVVGALIQGISLSARLLRVSRVGETLSRHPYGRYLLLTQLALLAGLYEAGLRAAGQIQELGLLLCLGGALCGVASILFLFFPTASSPSGPDMTLWAGLFLSICAWGGLIALDGEVGQPSLVALEILVTLTPLWSLGLFLALGGWLLRPFSWRQVADPRLPFRLRASLLLLILTAALPLGGLAAPFWIYAQRRLRPRAESCL
jgi:hypothetical protein